MPDYLLDANHRSPALRRVSPVRGRMHQARRAGYRFASCYPVLGELEVGFQRAQSRTRIVAGSPRCCATLACGPWMARRLGATGWFPSSCAA
jgi:hypothetical protein